MVQKVCGVDGCPNPYLAKGWCRPHYHKWHRYGDPLADGRALVVYPTTPPEVRFWKYVRRGAADQCWEWTGGCDGSGYGTFTLRGRRGTGPRTTRAHRFSWSLVNGPVPEGLSVLHRCDNPPCCNPAHLWVGTKGDNYRDRQAKGRTVLPDNRGSRNGMARFTERQVREIRAMHAEGGYTQAEVAARFNTSQTTVSGIVRRVRWTHI